MGALAGERTSDLFALRDRQSPIARAARVTGQHAKSGFARAVAPATVLPDAMPLGLGTLNALAAQPQLSGQQEKLLARQLALLEDMLARARPNSPSVAVMVSAKGGVGKSTLALLCADAVALARPDSRVLVCDLDVDGHGAMHMRTHRQSRPPAIEHSGLEELLVALLDGESDLDPFFYRQPSGARVLSGPHSRAARRELLGSPEALEFVLGGLGEHADLIICDLGAGVENDLAGAARELADTVVFISDAEPGSVVRSSGLLAEMIGTPADWAGSYRANQPHAEPTRLVAVVNQIPGWLAEDGAPAGLFADYEQLFLELDLAPLGIPHSFDVQRATWLMQCDLPALPLLVRLEISRLAAFLTATGQPKKERPGP